MKGQEGARLSPLILRNGKSWNLGDNLPLLNQSGGLVITTVSDFKSERPRNACLFPPSLLRGEAGVALASFTLPGPSGAKFT